HRDGYIAWEYYFAYGTGQPPWVSGMTQATAMQALSRGYRALGYARWKRTALRAMGAFELAPPAGIRVPAPRGSHYLLYSFAPGRRVDPRGRAAGPRPRRPGRADPPHAAPAAFPARQRRRPPRRRRLRHRRLVAVLRARRRVDVQLPRPDGRLPRRPVRPHE